MESDIQFGDVEQVGVQTAPRPDRNRHYAVAACGRPADIDLPVFVDLDAMLEMEVHALSDTSVELGGVMLGGQYEDDLGRSFVLVTDCLQAKHYKSTKGSFKFTHDTWQEITRQRDEFPADLQMVGWYHTHPGWGVFLSGLDTFICDNFFNRPLDLALVIDPCQQDRGFFQWSDGQPAQTRRTGGFYLVTSRFRRDELAMYAAYLGGKATMHSDADRGLPLQRMPAPVINISEGRPGWFGVAVIGMLFVQVFLTMLVAWRLVTPPAPAVPETQLTSLQEQLDTWSQEKQDAQRLAAEQAVLDRVIGEMDVAPGGLVTALTEQETENARLRAALAGYRALASENEQLRSAVTELDKTRKTLEDEIRLVQKHVGDLEQTELDRKSKIAELKRQIEESQNPKPSGQSGGASRADEGADGLSSTWLVAIIVAAGLAVVAVVVTIGWSWRRQRADEADIEPTSTSGAKEAEHDAEDAADRAGPHDSYD